MSRRARVLFRLSMPGRSSWDGRWSGEDRNYVIVRTMSADDMERAGMKDGRGRWSYSFGDGWVAGISGEVMKPGQRKPKSDGFCGYDWMVSNIVRWGSPACRHDWVDFTEPPYYEGAWTRCRHCDERRKVMAASEVA